MREPAHSSSQSILSNVNRRGADVLHQLFDRGFTWIVASEAVVDIGVLARVAAQSWVAYDLTGSSLWVGAVAAFRAIPSFLSPAVAAYIGNHVNHRILVAAMRACIGILAIIQAILIGTGAMRPWHQAVLTLFTGLAIAFAWPSFVTFLNDIVQPRMATRANAVLSYSHNLGELIGPIAVGIIIALVGADWSFVFIAILYLGGAIAHFTTNETALFTSAIDQHLPPHHRLHRIARVSAGVEHKGDSGEWSAMVPNHARGRDGCPYVFRRWGDVRQLNRCARYPVYYPKHFFDKGTSLDTNRACYRNTNVC